MITRTRFGKRVGKLEQNILPRRAPRILVRFAGPGSERLPQPTPEELDESEHVITVQFVEAKDGRPDEDPSQVSAGECR